MSNDGRRLRNMTPSTAVHDRTDRCAFHSVVIGYRLEGFTLLATFTYFAYLILGQLCHDMQDANSAGSMRLAVHDVRSLRVDSQVIDGVVGPNTVVVADDKSFRNWSDECLGNQPLNAFQELLSIVIADHQISVTIAISLLVQDYSASNSICGATADRANAADTGNLITAFKANDRTPLFGYDIGIHDVNLRNRFRCGQSRFGAYDAGPARVVLTGVA